MNEIANYGDLKTAVQNWLNRKDSATVENIPMFINFAEKQFTRLVRLPYYETRFTRTIADSSPWVEIPNDFLSIKHFNVNGFAVTRVDVETFTRIKKKKTNYDGKPYYFTRIGGKMYTYPDLKAGDEVEVIYNRDIPEMKKDDDCPYSLLIAPDVMLYLALRHASIFLRDNDQEIYWAQKATDAAMEINAQLDEAEWRGSSLVVREFNEE